MSQEFWHNDVSWQTLIPPSDLKKCVLLVPGPGVVPQLGGSGWGGDMVKLLVHGRSEGKRKQVLVLRSCSCSHQVGRCELMSSAMTAHIVACGAVECV